MNRQTVGGMTLSDPPLTRGMRYGLCPPQQVRDQQGPSDHVTEEGCCKPFGLGVRALPSPTPFNAKTLGGGVEKTADCQE